jgi:nucleoside-diphosphate-sugar epimerase
MISANGRCLVTGVAGFIGSHLAAELLARGHNVVGVDCMTDYYPRKLKEANLAPLLAQAKFSFVEENLLSADIQALLDGVDLVFHQAAQPGVRKSWGLAFDTYLKCNIAATQRLLEAAKGRNLTRFVFASSSSIYGDPPELPVRESTLPQPVSPYGVTKLAAEQLCRLYALSDGIPVVSLRYFTVYGPGQRPDMSFNRFIGAILEGRELELYGDGEQTRDFTFVDDAVAANLAAALSPMSGPWGRVYNIGAGSNVTMNSVLQIMGEITGKPVRVAHRPAQPGDARHTQADCSAARADLGWTPQHPLNAGLEAQVRWQQRSVT